ncbi:tyrosine phosphatase-like protein [Aspergillus karnatakaensis]|uniref:putative membrane protein n=1 Tax=Aspergillus karnatakaensis TaxID=1810916 RepID=UPI003CCD9651
MVVSKTYLLVYNLVSALLWLRILVGVVSISTSASNEHATTTTSIYTTLEPWARWTQTLSIIEILHSATGLTRAPIFTTFTQIFARSVQVWFINHKYPTITAPSPFYGAMLFAWSLADVVRYGYFVGLLGGIDSSSLMKFVRWLRYSLFIVLYPIGIGSEWWLMWKAKGVTEDAVLRAVWWFCLGLYGPGSVMMYTYMLKQRKKTLARGK